MKGSYYSSVWLRLKSTALEAKQEQIDGLFGQLTFECCLPEVASVEDLTGDLPLGCLEGGKPGRLAWGLRRWRLAFPNRECRSRAAQETRRGDPPPAPPPAPDHKQFLVALQSSRFTEVRDSNSVHVRLSRPWRSGERH